MVKKNISISLLVFFVTANNVSGAQTQFVTCESEMVCLYKIQSDEINVPVGAQITYQELPISGVLITLPANGENKAQGAHERSE